MIMPPEWHPQSLLWIGFPHDGEEWPGFLGAAQEQIARFANAVAESGQEVRLIVRDAANEARARSLCSAAVMLERRRYGDIWLRDTGPVFYSNDRCALFTFNGWGGKYVLDHDDTVGAFVAIQAQADATRWDRVLEGGAVDCDGEGTILTTRECLLNPNRNPLMTPDQIRGLLGDALGGAAVIWIERGLLNDHTDGHVDNIARFIAPGVVACQAPADSDDPNTERLDEIANFLKLQRDARGRMLQVVRIPSPGRVEDEDGDIVPASHMNFIIGNATVVVPTYGTATAHAAVAALKPYFPGRNVVGLPSNHILTGGGSFHCITQQQPE